MRRFKKEEEREKKKKQKKQRELDTAAKQTGKLTVELAEEKEKNKEVWRFENGSFFTKV